MNPSVPSKAIILYVGEKDLNTFKYMKHGLYYEWVKSVCRVYEKDLRVGKMLKLQGKYSVGCVGYQGRSGEGKGYGKSIQ